MNTIRRRVAVCAGLLCAWGLLGSVAAQPSPEPSGAEAALLREAVLHLNRGSYGLADELLDEVIGRLEERERTQGVRADARVLYRKSWLFKAQIAEQTGRPADVAECRRRYRRIVVGANPAEPPSLEQAEDHLTLGEYAEARDVLEALLRKRGPDPELLLRTGLWIRLATTRQHLQDASGAKQAWKEAAELAARLETLLPNLEGPTQMQCARHFVIIARAVGQRERSERWVKWAAGRLQLRPDGLAQKRRFLLELAGHYAGRREWDTSREFLQQALAEATERTDHASRAEVLLLLAGVETQAGRAAEAAVARGAAATALEELVAQAGDASPQQRQAWLVQLQVLHQLAKNWEGAARAARLLTETRAELWGKTHPLTLEARSRWGSILGAQGDLKQAAPILRDVATGWERYAETAPCELASAWNNLAAVERDLGRLDEAQALFQKARQLLLKHLQESHDEIAILDANVASVLVAQGRYSAGIENYQRLLRQTPQATPEQRGLRCTTLLNLAIAHRSQGQLAEAVRYCRAALVEYYEHFGAETFGAVAYLNLLCALERQQGRLPQAQQEGERALAIARRAGQLDHPVVATTHYQLGITARLLQDLDAAEEHWSRALEIQHATGQHQQAARTLNSLGVLEVQRRHAERAERYFDAALKRTRAADGESLEHYSTLCNLALVHDRRGLRDKARRELSEAVTQGEGLRRGVRGAEQERAEYQAQFASAYDLLMDWAVEAQDPLAALLISERSRSRALADQLELSGYDLRRSLRGEEGARLLADEAALRAESSALQARLTADAELEEAERTDVLTKLNTTRDKYAQVWKEIRGQSAAYRLLAPDVALLDPRALLESALHDDELLLVYYAGRRRSYTLLLDAQGAGRAYELKAPPGFARDVAQWPAGLRTAWQEAERGLVGTVVAPKGPAPAESTADSVASLGRGRLDALIQWFRAAILDRQIDAPRGLVGKVVAAKGTPPVAARLAEILLPAELRAELARVQPRRLIVVPDGPLHNLPLEALPVAGPHGPAFALEVLPPICYVPSCDVLSRLRERARGKLPGRIVLLGNPSYSTSSAAVPATPERAAWTGFGGPVTPLPETGRECAGIAARVAPWRGEVVSLQQTSATKTRLREVVAGCRFLHLATHGLVDESHQNLFGALALAPDSSSADSADDGFLTYAEILELPLEGCELTVLSACQTNVGPDRPLEAPPSLAQAFLTAGARRVVATHWNVADKSTADLMTLFYERLVADQQAGRRLDYAAALRDARRTMLGREQTQAPYFWAPFTLIGPGGG